MAYTPCYPNKRNWANLPSESSPINETNLNAMDNAIYTNDGRIVELSGRLDTDETALGNKVDKQSGKGLSEIKSITISPSVNTGTKIAEISYKNQDNLTIGYEIKNGVVVDSALSSSSENPVQNKVVKSAIDAKSTVSISDTLVTGDTIANLTINGTTTAIKAPLVEVDDTPSATSENPLQNKAIYEMLNNLLPEETAEGNPIAISDASGLNAKACSVDLLPIQDLHGYDSPWVGGAGKNKFQTTATSTTINGTVFTVNADGSVTIKNTPSTAISNYNIGVITLPAGTYKANGFSGGASNNIRLNFRDNDSTTVYAIIYDNRDIEFTLTEETDVRVYPIVPTTWDGNEVTMYPMIRLSSVTDKTFAPYSNICPISGRTEVNLTVADAETSPTQTETYTETLGQTVYGGNVDFVSGEGTNDRVLIAISDTTASNWNYNATYKRFAYSGLQSTIKKIDNASVARIISSQYIADSRNNIFNNLDIDGKIAVDSAGSIIVRDLQYTDVTTFLQNVGSAQICYELATPTELTLTPEEISLLKGNNTLTTDGDNINLVYSADIGLYIAGQLQNS